MAARPGERGMPEGKDGGDRRGLTVLRGGGAPGGSGRPPERADNPRETTSVEPARAGNATDEALARAFASGDEGAFAQLVARHERLVLAIASRYTSGLDDARDLAQRAFLKAFQAARRSAFLRRGEAPPFRAWLLRVAVNLGKNHARDARRWSRAPLAAVERERAVAPVGSSALERDERAAALREAVLALPRRQREVLTLRIDAELAFKDVAEALGITVNNAKVHFHNATVRLRALVAAAGAGEDAP